MNMFICVYIHVYACNLNLQYAFEFTTTHQMSM